MSLLYATVYKVNCSDVLDQIPHAALFALSFSSTIHTFLSDELLYINNSRASFLSNAVLHTSLHLPCRAHLNLHTQLLGMHEISEPRPDSLMQFTSNYFSLIVSTRHTRSDSWIYFRPFFIMKFIGGRER